MKGDEGAHGGKVAPGGQDEHFVAFFRLNDGTELDSLSMMACNRQGLLVEELLYKSEDAFRAAGRPEREVQAMHNTYETRRQAKLRLGEEEREELLTQLFKRAAQLSPTKQHLLLGTLTPAQFQQQAEGEIDAPEGENAESADARVTSDEEAVVKNALKAAAEYLQRKPALVLATAGHKMEADHEKLRKREMRLVEKEFAVEVDRQKVHARLQEREEHRMHNERLHHQALAAQGMVKRTAMHAKLERLHETTQINAIHKMEQFAEREEVQKQRAARRAAELAAEKRSNADRLTAQLHQVAERHQAVQDAVEKRSELQLQDMVHKQYLYYGRRKNIQLHRETEKELNKIRTLQRRIAMHEKAEKRAAEEEIWRLNVLDQHAESDVRLTHLKKELSKQRSRKKADNRQHEQHIHERLTIVQMHEQEKHQQAWLREIEKLRHSQQFRHYQQEEREFTSVQKRLRMQSWLDNKQRIGRVDEYRQMVKLAKVDVERRKAEAFTEERQRQINDRRQQVLEASIKRQMLLTEIDRLRASPNPDAFLKRAIEFASTHDAEAAASPRPARRTSPSSRPSSSPKTNDAPQSHHQEDQPISRPTSTTQQQPDNANAATEQRQNTTNYTSMHSGVTSQSQSQSNHQSSTTHSESKDARRSTQAHPSHHQSQKLPLSPSESSSARSPSLSGRQGGDESRESPLSSSMGFSDQEGGHGRLSRNQKQSTKESSNVSGGSSDESGDDDVAQPMEVETLQVPKYNQQPHNTTPQRRPQTTIGRAATPGDAGAVGGPGGRPRPLSAQLIGGSGGSSASPGLSSVGVHRLTAWGGSSVLGGRSGSVVGVEDAGGMLGGGLPGQVESSPTRLGDGATTYSLYMTPQPRTQKMGKNAQKGKVLLQKKKIVGAGGLGSSYMG